MPDRFYVDLKALAAGLIDPPDPRVVFSNPLTTREKLAFCQAMMEHYRIRWYNGKAETQKKLLNLSTRALRKRYAQYPPKTRAAIGALIWSRSIQARDLADQEGMFCRWANFYSNKLAAGGSTCPM